MRSSTALKQDTYPTTPSGNLESSFESPQSGPSRKRKHPETSSSPWNDTLTILVGPTKHKLIVHARFIRKIPFFRGCLDAPMQESQTRTITLPEENPLAVEDLVHWAYAGKLDFDLCAEAAQYSNDKTGTRPAFIRAIRLYALAKQYLVEDLQNHVLDSIAVGFAYTRPAYQELIEVYEMTDDEDGLRKTVMQRFSEAITAKKGWIATKAAESSYYTHFARVKLEYMEFTLDSLARYPSGLRARVGFQDVAFCARHVHVDTPKCDLDAGAPTIRRFMAIHRVDSSISQ